jgi:FkbM family methyltransferase
MKLSTRQKLRMAHYLYRSLRLVGVERHQTRHIRRAGITCSLDLAEGIDLSMYLFGTFQRHVVPRSIRTDRKVTVFAVGANFGVMSLQYARLFPGARIHAFEPSEYANTRFDRNIELNPDLRDRIERVKTFVSDTVNVDDPYTSYSSWKIDDLGGDRHPVHLGESHPTVDSYITLDAYCAARQIDDLYLIKIDTDGYEAEVLRGAKECIRAQKPYVIFELATYLLEEKGVSFDELAHPLLDAGYTLADLQGGGSVHAGNLDRMVPRRGSIDILATPPGVVTA